MKSDPDQPLEFHIGQALRTKGWTLAVAESCTGGLLGHLITNVSGSSDYFLGSIVAYADRAKHRLLAVKDQTLQEHGAVSRETALEMAHGARLALGADVGLAVTGIAGPGGEQPGKPVGLTWLAVTTVHGERAERHVWRGDRTRNKADSAQAALALLLNVLQEGHR